MRGRRAKSAGMFSYISTEDRIPARHPLRVIRPIVDEVLAGMSRRFTGLYASEGRPSIPPEQLMSALILQALYGVRSERMLMEQMNYNLLFRWFVGLSPDDRVWDASTFSKNRDRLLEGEVFQHFLAALLNHDKVKPLLSDEHFSVDGTLIEAWASHKSFQPKDGGDGDGTNFHDQQRTNDTHASITDPQAKLYRKAAGKEARLAFMGHALMENRNGLVVAGLVSEANGRAERSAAEMMIRQRRKKRQGRITLGADKGYDAKEHVAALRKMGVTAHVAQNNSRTKTGKNRKSAIDARTTRHTGYAMSQTCRKAIECVFGFGKQHGTMRKAKVRGKDRVEGNFLANILAYNLARLPKLIGA
jgi:transposase